jgi:hypothetical protein
VKLKSRLKSLFVLINSSVRYENCDGNNPNILRNDMCLKCIDFCRVGTAHLESPDRKRFSCSYRLSQEGRALVAQASLLKLAQAKACGYKKYLHDCNPVLLLLPWQGPARYLTGVSSLQVKQAAPLA